MYYSLYKDIKGLIAEKFGILLDPETGIVSDASNSRLKDIQWFNNQYEGVIHTSPVVLVEFAALDITAETKQTNSCQINIRLHVVARYVLDAVNGYRLDFEEGKTRPLKPVSWEHYHKYNGWMVTLVGLKTKG